MEDGAISGNTRKEMEELFLAREERFVKFMKADRDLIIDLRVKLAHAEAERDAMKESNGGLISPLPR